MLKKTLIFLLVVAVVVLGYVQLRGLRMSFASTEGKKAKVIRGDLTVPIEATGEILPARRIEIKAQASGEVIAILKQPGDLVRTGEKIMQLKPDDEKRNLERAQNDLAAAKARLEAARLKLRNTREIDLQRARDNITAMEQQLKYAAFKAEKPGNVAEGAYNEEEKLALQTAKVSAEVDLAQARTALAGVEISILLGEEDVKQAESALESAQRIVGDAEERYNKTEITSPIDGMIGEVRTQVGEVIQGGKTTITGGTLLATVIDMGKMIVRAEVDEADIGRVLEISPVWARPGNDGSIQLPTDWRAAAAETPTPPIIRVDTFRDEEFTGAVERIHPEPRKVAEAIYYYVDVVIVSENSDKLFKGMRADVSFTSQRATGVLLCPVEAIVEAPNKELGVHIPDPSAGADAYATKFVPCKIGLSNSVYSEVLSGLEEGMEVYTKLPSGPSSREKKN